jgi:hypothetical protein
MKSIVTEVYPVTVEICSNVLTHLVQWCSIGVFTVGSK